MFTHLQLVFAVFSLIIVGAGPIVDKGTMSSDPCGGEEGGGAMSKDAKSFAMLPPPPVARRKKKKKVVLAEDEWVSQLEAIIERDFFPEIPKLQSKLEWLKAVNSGDADFIKQAQRNTALRRAGFRTPLLRMPAAAAPRGGDGEWNTPLRESEGEKSSEWDEAVLSLDRRSVLNTPVPYTPAHAEPQGEEAEHTATNLSLDQFCGRYTSEDNESFEEILERANSKVREKRDRLYSSVKKLEDIKSSVSADAPCSTEGYGSSNQPPAGIITWAHKPMNSLFYDSTQTGASEVTEKERAKLYVRGPQKTIVHKNTRIQSTESNRVANASLFGSPSTSVSNTPVIEHLPSSSGLGKPVPRGGEGRGRNEEGDSDLRGYRYVKSPSPAPGASESPFMTYGYIEGTPVRLDHEGLEEERIEIPVFNVKPLSTREQLAHELVGKKNNASLCAKSKLSKKKAIGNRTSSLSPYAPKKLSKAGLKLASRLGKTPTPSRLSMELRASYTPTRKSE